MQTEESKEPEVHRRMHFVSDSLDELISTVGELERRLDCVMEGEDQNSDAQSQGVEPSCALGHEVAKVDSNILSVNDRLVSILRRLEV